jgi:serine protease Do
LVGGALALALATTALTPLAFRADAQPAPATAVALPRAATAPDFAELVARVAPAVVRVTVTGRTEAMPVELPPELRGSPFERFFRGMPGQQMPQQRRASGQGSGFIIDPAGYVVTNHHVVGRAESVKVELADGRELSAKVVGTDPQTDMALLKVEAGAPLPFVRFGDSDAARVGEWVLAMGNPFGLGGTATTGIVSARGRQIGAGPYDDFLQTDAAVNPGNSGGPLFNTQGEVIGVNTAIFSPSGANAGIGFAVPAKLAQQVIAQLKEHGRVERGWLGVSMQRMDEDLAKAVQAADGKGALVAQVEPDSPAAKGGLKAGDVVVGFNGQPIATPRDLAMAVAGVKPGSTATVAVLRDGQRTEQQVTIGQPPGTRMAAAGQGGEEEAGRGALGLTLAPMPAGKEGGAVVAQVRPDSVAAERGLKQGDVILRAGGREVTSPRDVVAAVKAARDAGRPSIALQIEREGGRRSFMALPLGQG